MMDSARHAMFGRLWPGLFLLAFLTGCDTEPGTELTPAEVPGEQAAKLPADQLGVETDVLAETTLPSGLDKPHYFKVLKVQLPKGASATYAAVDGMVYQLSGTQTMSTSNQSTTLAPGQGTYVYAGLPATFAATEQEPVEFLHFLLVPAAQVDRAIELKTGQITELYRSPEPMTDMPSGQYVFHLTKLTLPPHAPATEPHHRTGAALYYVASGTARYMLDGDTQEQAAGSLVYEPRGLVHQWSNPSDVPATCIVVNVSPQGKSPIEIAETET